MRAHLINISFPSFQDGCIGRVRVCVCVCVRNVSIIYHAPLHALTESDDDDDGNDGDDVDSLTVDGSHWC